MHYLYFNDQTQGFKIIEAGVTVTEHYDGQSVAKSESRDYLTGLASGLLAAKDYGHIQYEIAEIIRAIDRLPDVQIKED